MRETVTPPRADWERQTKVKHAETSRKITIRSERLEGDPPRKRYLSYQPLPRLSGDSATADNQLSRCGVQEPTLNAACENRCRFTKGQKK
jgi:hypothetical protein